MGATSRRAFRRKARWRPGLRESATFDRDTIAEIQRAAREGIYDIRGFGAKRRVPHFDDLLFLGASVSRYPLEGYRERCATDVTIGPGSPRAHRPRHPDHDRGDELRRAVGQRQGGARRGASEVGTSTTTGDGGMTERSAGTRPSSSTSSCRRATG